MRCLGDGEVRWGAPCVCAPLLPRAAAVWALADPCEGSRFYIGRMVVQLSSCTFTGGGEKATGAGACVPGAPVLSQPSRTGEGRRPYPPPPALEASYPQGNGESASSSPNSRSAHSTQYTATSPSTVR